MDKIRRFSIIILAVIIYFVSYYYFKLSWGVSLAIEVVVVFVLSILFSWLASRQKK